VAERDLNIRVTADTSQADAAFEAMWARERQRQAQHGQAGATGGPGPDGGGPGRRSSGSSPAPPPPAPPPPVAAAGGLPGNIPPVVGGVASNGVAVGNLGTPYGLPIVGAPAQGSSPIPPVVGGVASNGVAVGNLGTPYGLPIVGAPAGGGLAVVPPGTAAGALPGPSGGALATGGHPLGTWFTPGSGGAAGGALPPPGGGSGGWTVTGPPPPPGARPAPPGGQVVGWAQSPHSGREGVAVAAAGLGGAEAYQRGILASEREATVYSQQLGAEAAKARTENRELAALRGLPNTAATAAQIAREAGTAGLSADQWRDFQTGFQAYGGQYAGEGKKFSSEQATELQRIVAGYAVGKKGWSGADASRLLATVMSRSKAGASNEDILGQYGQLAEVMQLAPGYTGPLLGQLSEVVGETVGEGGEFSDPLGAATLLRGESERNPRQASAYTRAVIRGLRRAQGDPKAARELGLKRGMDTFQQLEAVQHAADAARARGEDEGLFLETHGFKEIRQFGGIRAALTYGQRGGAFDRARKEAGTPAEAAARVRREFGEYVSGEEGQSAGGGAATAAARVERGGPIDAWRRYQEHSAAAVESAGEMERGGVGAWLSHATAWAFGGRREQEIHADSVRRLQQSLESSKAGRAYLAQPYRPGEWYDSPLPGVVAPRALSRREYLEHHRRGGEDRVFAEMLAELKRINERLSNEGKRIAATRPGSAAATMGPAAGVTVRQPGAADGR
jgi:hypothetical protein